MGGKHSKYGKEKKNKKEKGFITQKNKKLEKIICPICNSTISLKLINSHTKSCISDALRNNKIKPCSLYSPAFDNSLNEIIFKIY